MQNDPEISGLPPCQVVSIRMENLGSLTPIVDRGRACPRAGQLPPVGHFGLGPPPCIRVLLPGQQIEEPRFRRGGSRPLDREVDADAHQGAIEARSEPDRGSTFIITLLWHAGYPVASLPTLRPHGQTQHLIIVPIVRYRKESTK
jgi:hypothetical protein